MQEPSIILDVLKTRSKNDIFFSNVYHILYNKKLYIDAFNELSNLDFKFTKVNSIETYNDIYDKRIDDIIYKLKTNSYKWNDSNFTFTSFKSLSVDNWKDYLLQRVLSKILVSIYSNKFINISYTYDNALKRIYDKSQACEYFIRFDIKDINAKLDINKLLDILKDNKIYDSRLFKLLKNMLKFKHINYDRYNSKELYIKEVYDSISFTLINIYLNELDKFINNTLLTQYNVEDKRPFSKRYKTIKMKLDYTNRLYKLDKSNATLYNKLKTLKKELLTIKSKEDIDKCSYRRLSYSRFIDSYILSFTGTYEEYHNIIKSIKAYTLSYINLDIDNISIHKADSKYKPATFLNYNIMTQWNNNKIKNEQRAITWQVAFFISNKIVSYYKATYSNAIYNIINYSDDNIIRYFQYKLIEVTDYFKYNRNLKLLSHINWILQSSLLKTLALKYKSTVKKIAKKYKSTIRINDKDYIVFKSLTDKNIYYGGIPMKISKFH